MEIPVRGIYETVICRVGFKRLPPQAGTEILRDESTTCSGPAQRQTCTRSPRQRACLFVFIHPIAARKPRRRVINMDSCWGRRKMTRSCSDQRTITRFWLNPRAHVMVGMVTHLHACVVARLEEVHSVLACLFHLRDKSKGGRCFPEAANGFALPAPARFRPDPFDRPDCSCWHDVL